MANDSVCTPYFLFKALDDEFHFELDAAASKENALCKRYWTVEDDALIQSWKVSKGKSVFVNPPYSPKAGPLKRWVEYGYWQAQAHMQTVVMLVLGDVSTEYWAFALENASEIRTLPRIAFVGQGAKFSSAIYVFRPNVYRISGHANIGFWDYRE